MAWSAPMTAVAGATFTASAFNTHVRDNLLETAPAKATAPSQLFVSTGPNSIATRVPSTDAIATTEVTNSTSYTDLTTPGPSVTVTTGTIAVVFFAAGHSNTHSAAPALSSVAVSGASTVLPSDSWAIVSDGINALTLLRYGMTHVFTGLTPGVNTFTMKYRAGSGFGRFQHREISVIPL